MDGVIALVARRASCCHQEGIRNGGGWFAPQIDTALQPSFGRKISPERLRNEKTGSGTEDVHISE